MKTSTLKPSAPRWLMINAEGQSLGRIATTVSVLLRGKNREYFSPHQVYGDHVIILHAEKLAFPEKKWHRKVYYKHTGHTGHLKRKTLQEAFEKSPQWVIEHAVKGMLPANRLRAVMLKRLHIFEGAEHTFAPQKPQNVLLEGKGLITIESTL